MLLHKSKIVSNFADKVRAEANRLQTEIDRLQPFNIPGTNILINYNCLHSMLDGKVKVIISEVSNNATCNCWICGAKPSEMAKRRGSRHSFLANRNALLKGGAPLHTKLRLFDYVCKFYFHQDFKSWTCR